MSFIEGIPELEGGLDDVLTLLGIAHNESVAEEISRLYKEADSLAVFTVKVTVALFWWASHMASATADAFGLAAQMQAESKTVNEYQLQTWKDFLTIKHPTEIRRVYIRTTKRIQVVKREIAKQQKVNLGPIKKELAALEKWKRATVTPELKQWTNFYAAWKGTYVKPMNTLVGWLHKPSTLANFVALPLIAVLPSNLRKPTALRHATAIETALLATWVKDPQAVYDAMLNWLVTG